MRGVFVLGSFLVSLAGIQLFILTEDTDHWFAWTIGVPITAAFLGAFYWTALVVAAKSAFKRTWVEARVGVMGVFVFITMTFVLTTIHSDRFHFDSSDEVARGAAYVWFIIYLVDPILVAVAWLLQIRASGYDRPPQWRIPSWFRSVLLVQGVAFMAIGCLLFLAPGEATKVWPWPLTTLTAQAMGAWMLGLGLVEVNASYENAWERIDVATDGYVALGLLQVIALLRYHDALDWSSVEAWAYVLVLASILLVGLYGSVFGRRLRPRVVPA